MVPSTSFAPRARQYALGTNRNSCSLIRNSPRTLAPRPASLHTHGIARSLCGGTPTNHDTRPSPAVNASSFTATPSCGEKKYTTRRGRKMTQAHTRKATPGRACCRVTRSGPELTSPSLGRWLEPRVPNANLDCLRTACPECRQWPGVIRSDQVCRERVRALRGVVVVPAE